MKRRWQWGIAALVLALGILIAYGRGTQTSPHIPEVISEAAEPDPLPSIGEASRHVEADGGTYRPRSDWASALYQTANLESGGPGRYEAGKSPRTRPFDDSDPEMQARMREIYAQGGCAQPGKPCEAAAQRFREGGDPLARYLITQFERSVEDGYPSANTYLNYVAYTESASGFDYIRQRVERLSELSLPDQRSTVDALSHTGNDGAIDLALDVLASSSDKGVRTAAINTLWRVPIATGHLPDTALAVLLDYRDLHWVQAERAVRYLDEHFDLPLDAEQAEPGSAAQVPLP